MSIILQRSFFVLCLFPFLVTRIWAQTAEPVRLPDTPPGRLAAAYIKAFNSGDEKVYREFVTVFMAKSALQQVPVEERLSRYREAYAMLGGYDLQRVMEAGQNRIQLLAKTRKAGAVELIFEVEPRPPHGLVGLQIERSEGPDGPGGDNRASPPGATVVRKGGPEQPPGPAVKATVRDDAPARIDQFLSRLTPFGFSGSVLVGKDDRVLFSKGYGLADRDKGIANTTETVFDTGSVGKQFTGAAVFKLEAMGRLNTADSIGKYLDDVPADKQAITIDHLLRHRSGVITSQVIRADDDFSDRDRRVRQILAAPLNFKPGERYQYNNAGYNLLAAIIEKVSGQSYQQFLYESLFKPAGMTSTMFQTGRFPVPGADQKTVARLYAGGRDNGSPRGRERFAWFFTGPGGILTTPGDLFKWHRALMSDQVLPASARQKYYQLAAVEGTMRETPRGRVIGHGGGTTMGTGAQFVRYLDAGVVIAACINNSGEEFNDLVTRNVTAAVFGGEVKMPPAVTALPPGALTKFTGTYALASGGRLAASVKDGQLWLAAEDARGIEALFGTTPSERYRKLEERTVALIEAGLKGDYGPLQKAMIQNVELDRLTAREQKGWAEWRQQHGAYKGLTVIGTTPEPMDDAAVTIRLNFERGSVIAQYVWFPRGLDGVRLLETAPGVPFYPADVTEFVNYRLLTGDTVRLRFTTDKGGPATGLLLTVRDVEQAAEREK